MLGRKKISPFLSDHRESELEPVPSRRPVALNPLAMFPSRRDALANGLFNRDLRVPPPMFSQTVDSLQWLESGKIDPHFGLKTLEPLAPGTSTELALKRSFRRVSSSQVFMPLQPGDVRLSELHDIAPGNNRKFVVVEESRLRELTKLENVLRQEKEKLGDQCVSVLAETNTTARIPVPAMRLAVHNICEAKMREAAKHLTTLYAEWDEHSRKNGYNKSHVYLSKSFAKSAPLAERALKLKLTKQAAAGWRVRNDHDSMIFEDSLGHLMRDYIEAQQRRRDYDRYFVLATRYGVFDEAEFAFDASPGQRYFTKVDSATRMLQKRWDMYWPMKKLRMHRACRFMQTLFRKYRAYKKWHPLIVLRMKYGKRTYYRYCLIKWKEYNHLCVKIRAAIAWQLSTYVRLCFSSWKTHCIGVKKDRSSKMTRFILRAKAGSLLGFFMKWSRFAAYSKRILRTARRIVQNPHLYVWVEYTKNRKLRRRRHRACALIQSRFRGIKDRGYYRKMRQAGTALFMFALRVIARRRMRVLRKRNEEDGFLKWYPTELATRHHKAVEKERRRLISCQQTVHDKEAAAIADLRRHLRTKNGRMQIRHLLEQKKKSKVRRKAVGKIDIAHITELQMRQNTKFGCLPSFGGVRYGAVHVKEDLIQQCSNLMRTMGSHDFNARSPAKYKCIMPHCNTYFVAEDQYRAHLENPSNHQPLDPGMADFHVLMKSPKTQELLRKHFGVRYGINTQVNCLDLWTCIQDWRRITIKTESYVHKAGQFYEAHLRPNCPRPADLHFEELAELHSKMDVVLKREYEGFYRLSTMNRGIFKQLLGFEGRTFEEWTTENIIPADLFNTLEYHCFSKLYRLYLETSFQSSEECAEILSLRDQQKIEHRAADFQLYLTLRKENFKLWVVEFKVHENILETEAAEKSLEIFMSLSEAYLEIALSDELFSDCSRRGYIEQLRHEETSLLADDASVWAEGVVLENVYDHYAEAIVKTMWDKPDCRKSLMEFAGFLEPRKRVDWSRRKTVATDWFQDFLNDAVEEEKKHFGLDENRAAIRIQKHARSRQGRRKAKKVFVNSFGKRYDKESKAYFYVNHITGDSSWERPLLSKYLLPNNSTW